MAMLKEIVHELGYRFLEKKKLKITTEMIIGITNWHIIT